MTLLIHSQILKKGYFIGVSNKIRIALIQDPEQLQEDSKNNSIKERKYLLSRDSSCESDKIGLSTRC